VIRVGEKLGGKEHHFISSRRGGVDAFPSEDAAREFGRWLDAHGFSHGEVTQGGVDFYWE
jgi:hypothetical protein